MRVKGLKCVTFGALQHFAFKYHRSIALTFSHHILCLFLCCFLRFVGSTHLTLCLVYAKLEEKKSIPVNQTKLKKSISSVGVNTNGFHPLRWTHDSWNWFLLEMVSKTLISLMVF
jgi:hypothetical protein